ncbi:MAG: hypothetical protein CML29_16485 [Rhizobiales bacterium]|nr:hypothetical protein [Hyphomicrobiales bacterium]MBA69696.1 hypothetical protein [Hyphomicrobiales bacterium]|tara:strand:+ start:480 stop:770 length:291 start_codon:yes stop_codon:yes gene_type:complete
MSIPDVFQRMTWRANLMEAMIRKLGLTGKMRRLPDTEQVMENAAKRCLTCEGPDQCQEWLARENSPQHAPAYCRNRDLFERVIAGIEADTRVSSSS